MRSLFPLVRLYHLWMLGWARKHMTRHFPTHPDLPKVIVLHNWWENAK